jgi:hypothetical protein
MPNIHDYTELVQLLLKETGKYFALLLFAVLAVRLWRRLPKLRGGKQKNFLLACGVSVIACGIGYFAIRQSLSLMYSYYGTRAFEAGNLTSASSLFQESSHYWLSPDALGKQGVCLLLSGKTDEGMQLMNDAKTLRQGRNTPFEEFYEGVHYFFLEQPEQAAPLLEKASVDPAYLWSAIKLLAVLQLDKNQTAEAKRLMSPFLTAEISDTDCDHVYIAASLDLAEGKKAEAGTLADKFPPEKLSKFWQPRFEKLRKKIQSPNP